MPVKPTITAWCDGSYRGGSEGESKKGGPIGGGFVLKNEITGAERSYTRTFNALSDSRKQGSMIAEIRAINAVLREAPKSHHIHICNDNRGVVKFMQQCALSANALETLPGKGGYDLHVAFNQAMLAIQRHDHVSFSWQKRSESMMRRAHELANHATKPSVDAA